jgi:polyisoprenoid-binding protein YceI
MRTELAGYPGALTGAWKVDPFASQVTLAVGHALRGTVRARFTELEGALFLHPDIRRSRALLLIDAGSVRTGRSAEEQWLRSAAFLDTDTHPYICLHSTEVAVHPSGCGERAVVTGELAIRDVARPMRCAVQLRAFSADSSIACARVAGQIRLSRADFGLGTGHDGRRGGVLLYDQLTVDLDVHAVRQPEAPDALRDPTSTPTHPAASQASHNPHGDES